MPSSRRARRGARRRWAPGGRERRRRIVDEFLSLFGLASGFEGCRLVDPRFLFLPPCLFCQPRFLDAPLAFELVLVVTELRLDSRLGLEQRLQMILLQLHHCLPRFARLHLRWPAPLLDLLLHRLVDLQILRGQLVGRCVHDLDRATLGDHLVPFALGNLDR